MDIGQEVISIDKYLRTSYRPDCDFVDDHIEERNAGLYDHSRSQMLAAVWFVDHEKEWKIISVMSLRTRVAQTRVRVSDISVLHADAPREQVTVTPPLLCIEVLSPEDRMSRITTRLDDFARMGVPHLWIIHPSERVGYIYESPAKLKLVTDRLAIPESPIYLDLPTLFAALD